MSQRQGYLIHRTVEIVWGEMGVDLIYGHRAMLHQHLNLVDTRPVLRKPRGKSTPQAVKMDVCI